MSRGPSTFAAFGHRQKDLGSVWAKITWVEGASFPSVLGHYRRDVVNDIPYYERERTAKRTPICEHALGTFTTVETGDGSLTACFGEGETMHSLRGAFNETVYIYGTALENARNAMENIGADKSPRTLSLGLGLGYVELLASAYAAKRGQLPRGESFDLVDDLNASFLAWLRRDEHSPLVPFEVYDEIAQKTATHANERFPELKTLSADDVRASLAQSVENGDWFLLPALSQETKFENKFECVAFDAFSSKSTPELWTRDFLDPFLRDACGTPCVLSTYACTGHLKRALVDAGFKLEIREGYASKRDCTLASRA